MSLRPPTPTLALAAIVAGAPLLACGGPRAVRHGASHGEAVPVRAAPAHDPTLGVHGMVVLPTARDRVFLSHLPLYRAPHDAQLVLSARLVGDARTSVADPAALLAADRRRHGNGLYTLEPERASRAALARASAVAPVRLRATVYRGHFERGGEPVVRGVLVVVDAVVADRALDDGDAAHGEPRLLLFGGEGVVYAAHHIGIAPDFDQLVRLELYGTGDASTVRLHPAGLASGVSTTLVARSGARRDAAAMVGDGAHALTAPLDEGESIALRLPGLPCATADPSCEHRTVHARVVRQLYLELGELARE